MHAISFAAVTTSRRPLYVNYIMSYSRGTRLWSAVAAVAVLSVAGSMVLLTRAARGTSEALRQTIFAPVEPVTRASLAERMGEIPPAPFLALDEEATNAPLTRVMVGAGTGLGAVRDSHILLFRSAVPFETVVMWYGEQLEGWTVAESPSTEEGVRLVAFHGRDGRRLAVAQMPHIADRIVLMVGMQPEAASGEGDEGSPR
jgi:hypothetical protein